MGGFASIVRGALAGANEAAGNQQTANDLQAANQRAAVAKQAEMRAKILPHALAIQGLRTKLQGIDPTQNPEEHAAISHDIARNMEEISDLIYPDRNPRGNFFERGITDRIHLTSLKNRERKEAERRSQKAGQAESGAQAIAQGIVPYNQDPKFVSAQAQEVQKARDAQKLEEMRAQSASDVANIKADAKDEKAPKGLKALEQGGVAYGVQDQDSGQQYLPSQLGPNGNAPAEAKQIWKTIQDAKAAKQAEEDHKEDERDARQSRSIGAAFERMGRQQEFQENMAQYRSDQQTYRALDKQAKDSESTVRALESQYGQPGNKSVADNELVNFYTTVTQKGGRKTNAELNLTLKIGSFGLNLQQMAQKAASGELPPELRKMLLDGMRAVAKEQRSTADDSKPEMPQITAPGKGAKSLKDTRKQQTDPLGVL